MTFCIHVVILYVYTKREVMKVSPRTGRPKAEHPKSAQLKIRVDNETLEKLNTCCEKTGATKSAVVRQGIEMVWQSVK